MEDEELASESGIRPAPSSSLSHITTRFVWLFISAIVLGTALCAWLLTPPFTSKSEFKLAREYDTGIGVRQDDEQAAHWYLKAAEDGYAPAQVQIGLFYLQGRGIEQSKSQALLWINKAAEQGDAIAFYNLAVSYETGDGVPQNEPQAIYWFQKAAAQGQAGAIHKLEEIKRNSSASQSISDSEQFAVCRVRKLEFYNTRSHGCQMPEPYCDNMSRSSESRSLEILSKAGYIGGAGHPITTQYSSGTSYWTPNARGQSAMGREIHEEQNAPTLDGVAGYVWTLILGCRKLRQVDASTPLTDGLRVEFSWNWEPTSLGLVDGLNSERQRGVAYLVREGNGLKVERIQINGTTNE